MVQWCTAKDMAALITAARLSTTVPAADRKTADLAFIALCDTCPNAGDVLVQLAMNSDMPAGLRLNAALAARPLLTVDGWCRRTHFQQTQEITSALMAYAAATLDVETGGAVAKVANTLCACVADIVALEFAAGNWKAYVLAVTDGALQQDAHSGHLLLALGDAAAESPPLWWFLSNDVSERIARSWATTSEASGSQPIAKTQGLRLLLRLMQRRPRPSALQAVSGGIDCFLLSEEMSAAVVRELERCVGSASSRAAGPEAAAYFADCDAVLGIAQRLVRSASTAGVILRAAVFFVSNGRELYARLEVDITGALASLIENALECLLSVLQAYPDAIGGDASIARGLLQTLVSLMMPRSLGGSLDGHMLADGAAQDVAMLSELIMADEVVPLGCASGDIPSLASAVAELFLEASPAHLPLCVEMLTGFVAAVLPSPTDADPVGVAANGMAMASAAGRALRSIARVFADKDASVMDSVPPAVAGPLASAYAALIEALCSNASRTQGTNSSATAAAALLLESFSFSFVKCTSPELCSALLGLVEGLCSTSSSSSCTGSGLLVATSVYVVARLLTETKLPHDAPASAELRARLASVAWLSRAMTVMACAGPDDLLSVYCGGAAVGAIVTATGTPVRGQLAADADGVRLLSACLENLCRHCQTRAAAELFTQLLKQFAAHSSAMHVTEVALAQALHTVISAVGHAVHSSAGDDTRSDTLIRAVASFALDLARGHCRRSVCGACAEPLLRLCLCILCTGAELRMVLLDEGGSRVRCAAIATALVALHNGETGGVAIEEAACALTATAKVACGAVEQALPASTISACCGNVAALYIAFPSAASPASPADRAVVDLLARWTQVTGPSLSPSPARVGGVNHLGECLLLSVRLIANPGLVGAAMTSAAADTAASADARQVLGWCCSLLPFADAFTATYMLAAFMRILQHFARSAELRGLLAATMLPDYFPLCYLPSALVKSVAQANCISHASLPDAIAFAAISMELRRTRTTKASFLSAELTGALPLVSQWGALTGEAADESIARLLTCGCPVLALCESVLHELAAMGLGGSLPAIREFVSSRVG